MPATFVIDHDRKLVLSRAWGILAPSDLEATQRGIQDDKRFEPMYRQIYDFSEVTEIRVTGSDLQSLAYTSPFSQGARRAIVVNSDAAYGMARMYGLMGDRDSEYFRVFRDRQSALRWLGVEESATAPLAEPKVSAPRAME
jgi:hypothetical protein